MRAANKPYFYYLFLDIEWNQTPGTDDMENREPILLALVTANAELEKTKRLSKALRICDPKCLNEESMKTCHTCAENIMTANDPEIVFQSINRTFSIRIIAT